ncbi:hypothetical protein AALP_AA8G274300 [Arabis alpina]|uniref:Pectinesterase inhibitor domain-containing protein n=1 Tax=Arabis alpina TaxID=50452 RepID=A0A087G9T5_ARAAL|nr:hypothetical protein AALP_AA8G274300 [Arabis alpina]
MASSSYGFVLVFLALVSQFVLASASTAYIDAICKHVTDNAFCIQTLSGYRPAASATSTFQVASAVLRLDISYAHKSAGFSAIAAIENPALKKQFKECQDAFRTIIASLKSAASELKESPDTANYDVMVCTDSTTVVKNLVGKYSDKASKNVIMMTLMMEKLLAIAVGATVAVGG